MEAREYDELLTNKLPNLASMGARSSDLYYTVENSTVEVLESTCNWSNKISLTSKSFGSNSQINMPMSAFLGQVILHLQLPVVQAAESIIRGWGLRMIRTIRYQMGASSSSPIIITNQAIWHTLLVECDTAEKRSQMFELCGAAAPTTPTTTVLAGDSPLINEAFIPLPLPFSSLCKKLMFDSTIIGQPITIFIEFESLPQVIYGGTATHPTEFLVAEVLVRQQNLANQASSLRNKMLANPQYLAPYPYNMALGYETAGPFPGASTIESTGVSVQLNQFMNSDLLAIVLSVHKVTDLKPAGTDTPNPYHMDEISNVEMTYNGGMIFQLPGKSWKATSAFLGGQGASTYSGCYTGPGPSIPTCTPTAESVVVFDFTLLRSICYKDHLANTWRIPPGNVLVVKFNTSASAANASYRCFYTCYYNSIIAAQAGGTNTYT